MNKLFLVLVLAVAQSSFALDCTSEGWIEGNPIVTFSAEPIFKDGQLVALNGFQLNYVSPDDQATGEDVSTPVDAKIIWADASYKPRTVKDRVRFNIDTLAEMEWANKTYGGIIHAIILPKSEAKIAGKFNAILSASDDPYHDGIFSYYRLICEH